PTGGAADRSTDRPAPAGPKAASALFPGGSFLRGLARGAGFADDRVRARLLRRFLLRGPFLRRLLRRLAGARQIERDPLLHRRRRSGIRPAGVVPATAPRFRNEFFPARVETRGGIRLRLRACRRAALPA